MARCKHGIELDVLVCEQGCGGTQKSRTAATSGKRLPEANRQPRPKLAFTDDEMRTVLLSAPSIRGAASRLGCSLTTLHYRAKRTKELWAVYQGAADRGRANSRRLQGHKTRRSA